MAFRVLPFQTCSTVPEVICTDISLPLFSLRSDSADILELYHVDHLDMVTVTTTKWKVARKVV